jgi:Bacterial Ig-like domain (group 2)
LRRILFCLVVLLFPWPVRANWGMVQQAESTFVQGTTVTAQFPANVTPGDLILVHVVWSDVTINVSSIKDKLGNSLTSAVLAQGTAGSLAISTQLFYAANVIGGTDGVTVTLSGSAYLNIYIYEISGAVQSNPLDVTATGNGIGFSTSTGSATTGAANDLVFVATGHHFGYDTPGAGFVGLQSAETGLGEFQIVASAGTSVAGASSLSATSSGYPWAAALAAFKMNAGTTTGGNPTLTSIQITPFSPTLSMGQVQQLSAIGSFSDGSTQDLTSSAGWGSANTGIASVSNSGLATAAGHGTTTVTASSGSITGSTPLTVEGTLTSLQVTPTNDSITAGATQQYTATGTFSDGTTENLTSLVGWTSSNTAVATINASGTTTAFTAGSATVTASSGGLTGSTTLTVTQPAGGSTPLLQTPLVQTNYEWMTQYYVQHPPTAGGSACAPAPCISQGFVNSNNAGDMILVWVSWNSGGFSLTSLSDSAGNSYTHIPGFPITNSNGIVDDFWVAYNIVANSKNKITGLFGSGTAKNAYLQIMEYSGLVTSNALDVYSNTSQNPTCTAPCTLSSAPSPITTQASELIVSVFDLINCGANCGTSLFTTGSGWVPDANCTSCVGWGGTTVSGTVLIEHQIVSSIGSFTATGSESNVNSPNYDGYLFAFKRTATGP